MHRDSTTRPLPLGQTARLGRQLHHSRNGAERLFPRFNSSFDSRSTFHPLSLSLPLVYLGFRLFPLGFRRLARSPGLTSTTGSAPLVSVSADSRHDSSRLALSAVLRDMDYAVLRMREGIWYDRDQQVVRPSGLCALCVPLSAIPRGTSSGVISTWCSLTASPLRVPLASRWRPRQSLRKSYICSNLSQMVRSSSNAYAVAHVAVYISYFSTPVM